MRRPLYEISTLCRRDSGKDSLFCANRNAQVLLFTPLDLSIEAPPSSSGQRRGIREHRLLLQDIISLYGNLVRLIAVALCRLS